MDSKSLLIGAALAGSAAWGWPRARDWWRRKRTPPPDIQLRDAGLFLLEEGVRQQRAAEAARNTVPVGGIPYEVVPQEGFPKDFWTPGGKISPELQQLLQGMMSHTI